MALIVCIGNELVADDAVGFEVHARLAQRISPEVRLSYCGVGGLVLLDLLDGTETAMIVVDAVSLGAPVGTVHRMMLDELPVNSANPISAHGIGLRETMEIGAALYPERMPQFVALVGVEGRCFDLPREHMSPEVSAATEVAVDAVLALLRREAVGGALRRTGAA
jgi:hydrogenase maturation protease